MAKLTDLPNEVVQDIIHYAFLNDQTHGYLPHSLMQRFSHETCEHALLSEFAEAEQLESVASGIQSLALSRLLSGSSIRAVFDLTHTRRGGRGQRNWRRGFIELGIGHQPYLQAIPALSKTSRKLYQATSPLMWKTVAVNKNIWRETGMADYAAQFIKNPHFADYVLDLNILNHWEDFTGYEDWRRVGDQIREAQAYVTSSTLDPSISAEQISQKVTRWSPFIQFYILLSMLPNLRVIRLLAPFKPNIMHIFQLDLHPKDIPLPVALQNLREIAFNWENEYGAPPCVQIFALPSINTIYFKISSAKFIQGDEDELSELNGNSRVKDLIIDSWQHEPISTIALLKLPSSLEYFTFNYHRFGHHRHHFSRLAHGLLVQRHSLKRIHIGMDLRMNGVFAVANSAGFWKQFRVLEELCLPINFLLFDGGAYSFALKDSLPESLASLRMCAVNISQIDFWIGQLLELFECKVECNPYLKTVRVDHWRRDSTDEDHPHIPLDISDERFCNIVSRAKEVGVDLLVDVEVPY